VRRARRRVGAAGVFGAWAAWARGQAPRTGTRLLAAANDVLKPFQRRVRANARRLGRPGKLC